MEHPLASQYRALAETLGEIDLVEKESEKDHKTEELCERISQSNTIAGKISLLVDLVVAHDLTAPQIREILLSPVANFVQACRADVYRVGFGQYPDEKMPKHRVRSRNDSILDKVGYRFTADMLESILNEDGKVIKVKSELLDSFFECGIIDSFVSAFRNREEAYDEKIRANQSLGERIELFKQRCFGHFYGSVSEQELALILGENLDWETVQIRDFSQMEKYFDISGPDWEIIVELLQSGDAPETLKKKLRKRFDGFADAEELE